MYTFSFYKETKIPFIVKRSWWNLFGRDRIDYKSEWVRYTIPNITEEEAIIFMAIINNPSIMLVLSKYIKWYNIQLECGSTPSAYIPTNAMETNNEKS